MKRLLPILLPLILLLIIRSTANAQYVIKEADAKYELFDYVKAIDLYEQAYRKKQTLHAAGRLAICYSLVQNYKETESWYAIAANMPGSDPADMLNYARALQNNAKYTEARDAFIKYAALDNKVAPAQKNAWLLSCDSSLIWMKAPRHVTVDNLKTLNTPKSDWGAVAYGNDVVFSSDRIDMPDYLNATQKSDHPFLKFNQGQVPDKKIYGWTGNSYLRLYIQRDKVGDINYFPATVKTDYHVGPASFTADGNEMYFTLTRIPKKSEYDKKGNLRTINVEIYSCKKDSAGNWALPVAFKYNKVGEYSVGDPFISRDGGTLYFVSNMPGGKGGTDIYYCKKTGGSDWGAPVNLVDINTPGNERTPWFAGDTSFYFSSDGWIGMGGLDIYRSTVANGKFAAPVNMGYPFNSPRDDFAFNFDSMRTGYFSSNRPDGLGSDDIYRFTLPEPPKPKAVVLAFALEGVVYDKKSNQPLADAIVSLAKTGGMPLKVQTGADGSYRFDLAANTAYNINGDKTDYRSDAATATTVGLKKSTVIKRDLYLEKIDIGVEIVLKNIYYDFDKSNIRPDAAKELDKLVKIMQDNPTMWIELGSHTDSRGNAQYNQWLSQSRANSAVQYIIDRGISKNRITAKGYGKSKPVNGCFTGVPCTEAQHQANRRTEFTIVKY